MNNVFPAFRMVETSRSEEGQAGQLGSWEDTESWLEVEQEAQDYIDATIGERFGVSPFFLMNLTKDPLTWAVVLFSDIISQSDEVLRVRGDLRDQIRFAAYGNPEPGTTNPPLGAMAVLSSEALKIAAPRHEVFRRAWKVLGACDPNSNWVAIVDLGPRGGG